MRKRATKRATGGAGGIKLAGDSEVVVAAKEEAAGASSSGVGGRTLACMDLGF